MMRVAVAARCQQDPKSSEYCSDLVGVTRFSLNPSLASYVRDKLADLD